MKLNHLFIILIVIGLIVFCNIFETNIMEDKDLFGNKKDSGIPTDCKEKFDYSYLFLEEQPPHPLIAHGKR